MNLSQDSIKPDALMASLLATIERQNAMIEKLTVAKNTKGTRTVGYVLDAYLESVEFKRLKPVSQSSVRRHLVRALANYTGTLAVEFGKEQTQLALDQFGTLESQFIVLKRLRTLSKWAEKRGWFEMDPTKGMQVKLPKDKEQPVWTDGDTAKFRAAYPSGRQRVVLELALHAQRRADVAKVRWDDIEWEAVKPGQNEPPRAWWRVKQQKTGVVLRLPLHREAVEALLPLRKDAGAIVTREGSKKALSAQGLGNLFAAWCEPIGITRRLHSIRRHVATKLAGKGATPHQIAAWTGHKTLTEVQRYTASVDQASVAEKAAALLAA